MTLQTDIGTQTFTATVTNTPNTAVTWDVNGVAGGNSTVGTISAAGVYSAPLSRADAGDRDGQGHVGRRPVALGIRTGDD